MPKPGPKYSRLGVLDIGSNSVRFVIYEIFGASFTPVYNEKVLAGLGRDLRSTGALSPEGRDEALIALKRFTLIAQSQNLDRIVIGATAAMRDATDAADFINQVKHETGLDITPVSGKEEARLTALGLIAAEPRAHGIAADLGGASLELIPIENGHAQQGVSFPIGPFQMMGRDLGRGDTIDVDDIKSKIHNVLDQSDLELSKGRPLYLIGGAWRHLAGIHQSRHLYPLKTLQAYALMPGAARDLACWAYGPGRRDILSWPDTPKRRAETLPYSGIMLDILLSRLSPPRVIISTTGLREGLVYDALPKASRGRDALLDGCRDLAAGSLQGVHFAQPLIDFLTPLERTFKAAFEPVNETRLRRAACHLVGVGKGLHPDYRAALVFEDVLYAPMSGLTHKERAYLALILFHSYTGSQVTPNPPAINLLLSMSEREAARAYGSAIRLGVVASARTAHLLEKFKLTCENEALCLQVDSDWTALLTERVSHRLQKLGQFMQMNVVIQ